VGGKAGAPALGVEIILIPGAVLLLGWSGLHRLGDVLDIVAIGGHQAARAFGPQCGHYAGCAAAPVVPSGAAPPPGFYFDNLLQWAPGATGVGQLSGLKVNAVVNTTS